MKYIIALMLLLMPVTSWAMDKKLGATNCFLIGIFDEFGNGISTGLDIVTPFSNLVIKTNCGSPSTTTTVDEIGDTIEASVGGYYYICANDAITNAVEDECMGWVEGEGDHLGLIALVPKGFKAVGATMSQVGLLKSITASSATTSTITSAGLSEASNKDYVGGVINCPNATAADNRAIFLRIISFNPFTDTITLNGLFASVLSADDVCDIYIDTVR